MNMETSNNIDINDKWYRGKMIASAGSSVTIEAGSQIIIDYSIDLSHAVPHINIKLRVASEGQKAKGKKVEKLFGDLHFIDLEICEAGSTIFMPFRVKEL